MTRKETRFTNFLRSRGVGIIIALSGAWMSMKCVPSAVPLGETLPWLTPTLSWGLNILLIFLIAATLIAVNRTFNLLKTLSVFFAAYFVFITCATPCVASSLGVAAPLALTVTLATWILFSIYNQRRSDRRIFLIFTLLSAGTLWDWKFLFFVPVFFIGLAQMRILRFKKIVAALIGLITPPWIAWGLGLMELPSLPLIFFTPPTMLLEQPGAWPFLCTVALTMVTGFMAGTFNLLRILGFNARARAYNGFLALLGITTGLLAIVNFTALHAYVILLNVCVALQVGHFFRATVTRRGYIFILILLAAYIALYVWSILS